MATSTDPQDATSAAGAEKLGFDREMVIQEFGYDDDVDHDLRSAIEDISGTDLVDEDYDDVTDGVVVWYRDGEDDLTDLLAEPKRVVDCFSRLFRRAIGDDMLGMATGESLAHLNCLMTRGEALKETDSDGVIWYRATA